MRLNRWWVWRSSERGFFTLIALLIVIVIIGILFATQMGGPVGGGTSGGPGEPSTMLGGAVNQADKMLCRNNLGQLRSAIAIYQGNMGGFPPSLEMLQSNVSLSCPVGGEPYQYDPTTGAVHCVHRGHEGF